MEAAARVGRLRPAAALIPVSLSLTAPTGPGRRRTRCCSHKSRCLVVRMLRLLQKLSLLASRERQDDAFDDRRLTLNPTGEPSSLCWAVICFSLSNSDVPGLPACLSQLPVLQDHLDPAAEPAGRTVALVWISCIST